MRRPLRATAIAIVLSSILAVVAAMPVAADGPTRVPVAPIDTVFTGVCSFQFRDVDTRLNETMQVRPNPDGSVTYFVSGQDKITLTNLETGYTLSFNSYGPYRWTVNPDGTTTAWGMGPKIMWPGFPDTIFHGRLVATYAPGWVLMAWHLSGHSESLCAALDH